jgi:hypothetical protein
MQNCTGPLPPFFSPFSTQANPHKKAIEQKEAKGKETQGDASRRSF